MEELILALAMMCKSENRGIGVQKKQRECVAEILDCLPRAFNTSKDKLSKCIQVKKKETSWNKSKKDK